MENNLENQILNQNNQVNNEPTIINTDINSKNGQDKCPKCGATDISLNINTGKLRCNFCRYEFSKEVLTELKTDISQLEGEVIASGATKIDSEFKDVVTLKCSSCGAEVVIDTSSTSQARCHWCRNTLSINKQIPNGSIPDMVLPFKVTKEEAKKQIEKFVGKRKFYAHPKFKSEFKTDNIMGVYFPYMLVDVNASAKFQGHGEHQTRKYQSDDYTYYDADLYEVSREFDLTINGLTIESNSDKLNNNSNEKTNNVINAIMPFDIENCIKFNANFLRGYTSEKRDTDVETLKPIIKKQAEDVARFACNDTLKSYDRGVNWSNQEVLVKGQRWSSAYLPVWLYSYQQTKGKKKILHYVAVNARTLETMGSVPIHMPKLIAISTIVEIIGIILMFWVDSDYSFLFLIFGVIYFIIMFNKYRNSDARHKYEKETKKEMTNLKYYDNFVKHETGLGNSKIKGANNTYVSGKLAGSKMMEYLGEQTGLNDVMDEYNRRKKV